MIQMKLKKIFLEVLTLTIEMNINKIINSVFYVMLTENTDIT